MDKAMIRTKRTSDIFIRFLLALTFILGCCFSSTNSYGEDADSVCAVVKIEIQQDITLERQGFSAHMRINNNLTHIAIEDINIVVSFTDEDGNDVLASSDTTDPDAVFFIKLDSLENINDINGNGVINTSTSADIYWLIIPAPGASDNNPNGKLYYVGATLTYTNGGEANETVVSPDYIFVKPMPSIQIDYFIPVEVYGDDAFTTEVEAPIPFALGIRAKNNGYGTAKNFKVDCNQPEIVDNEQGLLVDFVIEGTEVNGEIQTDSLTVDLGDIEPNTAAVARWIMSCSLSGTFEDFTADFSHSDELGGELTSLITKTETHFSIRDVLVDLPGRDSLKDFLVYENESYTIFETDAPDSSVITNSASLEFIGYYDSESRYQLSCPGTSGFVYIQLTDPNEGESTIKKVVRSDGKQIKSENAWLSKSRNEQSWDYYLNLFDINSTGSYTFVFGSSADIPQAPILQYIPDREGMEGKRLSFIIQATDPNGTTPILSVSSLPAGAVFTDEGNGYGIFDWTPATGQSGVYELRFKASDGDLYSERRTTLTIYGSIDSDGDGLPDEWEMSYFGTLDRNGTGDYDGDGVSDYLEYLYGTDPTIVENAPSVPVIESPSDGTQVDNRTPNLVIINSTDPESDTLTYDFEIYSDESMNDLVSAALNQIRRHYDYGFDRISGSLTTIPCIIGASGLLTAARTASGLMEAFSSIRKTNLAGTFQYLLSFRRLRCRRRSADASGYECRRSRRRRLVLYV